MGGVKEFDLTGKKYDIFTSENVNMNFLGKHSRTARLS